MEYCLVTSACRDSTRGIGTRPVPVGWTASCHGKTNKDDTASDDQTRSKGTDGRLECRGVYPLGPLTKDRPMPSCPAVFIIDVNWFETSKVGRVSHRSFI